MCTTLITQPFFELETWNFHQKFQKKSTEKKFQKKILDFFQKIEKTLRNTKILDVGFTFLFAPFFTFLRFYVFAFFSFKKNLDFFLEIFYIFFLEIFFSLEFFQIFSRIFGENFKSLARKMAELLDQVRKRTLIISILLLCL